MGNLRRWQGLKNRLASLLGGFCFEPMNLLDHGSSRSRERL
jgi:hypothetical protein